MAILANRIKIRNNMLELSKFVIHLIKKTFTIILLLSCMYLLYFSTPKTISNIVLETVGKMLSIGSLIYNETTNSFMWINNRLLYFKDIEATNFKLRSKIAYLEKRLKLDLDLRSENSALKTILNMKNEVTRDFVTAKVIGLSNSPFASSAILQSGIKNNIKINDIVRGSLGLVGRVSEVSEHYCVATLIGDHNSRIPAITNRSKTKGILARQGDNLQIIYLEEGHKIFVGETVYTSGDGKIFPQGLPIAKVVKVTDNTALVESIEELSKIEYVVIESNVQS
jgi:rod shape-determining protein MreC